MDAERIYKSISGIPKIARGIVWCTKCGRSEKVNGGDCMRYGWPRCCGYTMTIDSPDERAARNRNEH